MYKVKVTYRKSGNSYEIKFKTYQSAYDYAAKLKEMVGDQVIAEVETTVAKNGFTAHIMTRFERRN